MTRIVSKKNFVRAIEHFFFRFSLQCLKPPAPARFRASWSPPGIGLRHLGIPRYVSIVDIQVLTSYLLEMQNLSKIKKWQSIVTATAKKKKKIICVQRDLLVGMYALTLHR